MRELSESAARLRPWIAPALGVGLIVGGIAMLAGLSSAYAPGVGAVVAGGVLSIGEWGLPAWRRRSAGQTPEG